MVLDPTLTTMRFFWPKSLLVLFTKPHVLVFNKFVMRFLIFLLE